MNFKNTFFGILKGISLNQIYRCSCELSLELILYQPEATTETLGTVILLPEPFRTERDKRPETHRLTQEVTSWEPIVHFWGNLSWEGRLVNCCCFSSLLWNTQGPVLVNRHTDSSNKDISNPLLSFSTSCHYWEMTTANCVKESSGHMRRTDRRVKWCIATFRVQS